jgi:hypothetical protein
MMVGTLTTLRRTQLEEHSIGPVSWEVKASVWNKRITSVAAVCIQVLLGPMEIPGSEGWHETVLLAFNRWMDWNNLNSPWSSMKPSDKSTVFSMEDYWKGMLVSTQS